MFHSVFSDTSCVDAVSRNRSHRSAIVATRIFRRKLAGGIAKLNDKPRNPNPSQTSCRIFAGPFPTKLVQDSTLFALLRRDNLRSWQPIGSWPQKLSSPLRPHQGIPHPISQIRRSGAQDNESRRSTQGSTKSNLKPQHMGASAKTKAMPAWSLRSSAPHDCCLPKLFWLLQVELQDK